MKYSQEVRHNLRSQYLQYQLWCSLTREEPWNASSEKGWQEDHGLQSGLFLSNPEMLVLKAQLPEVYVSISSAIKYKILQKFTIKKKVSCKD